MTTALNITGTYRWPEQQCKHPPPLGYPRGHDFLDRAAKYILCFFRQKCCFHTPEIPGDFSNFFFFFSPPQSGWTQFGVLSAQTPVFNSRGLCVAVPWLCPAQPLPALPGPVALLHPPASSFGGCWQRLSLWLRHSKAITRWHGHLRVRENYRVSLCVRHTLTTVLHLLHI